MGDHRPDSQDSRDFGPIDKSSRDRPGLAALLADEQFGFSVQPKTSPAASGVPAASGAPAASKTP